MRVVLDAGRENHCLTANVLLRDTPLRVTARLSVSVANGSVVAGAGGELYANCWPVSRLVMIGAVTGPLIWNTGHVAAPPLLVTVICPPARPVPKTSGNTNGKTKPSTGAAA